MKLFSKAKDGGPESTVTGYFICEFKKYFSIVLLKFEGKSREAYHEHAFNCVSWILKGKLIEHFIDNTAAGTPSKTHVPSLLPIFTNRDTYHKVDSDGVTWVISFRGPWLKTWKEYLPNENRERTLTNGRIECDVKNA